MIEERERLERERKRVDEGSEEAILPSVAKFRGIVKSLPPFPTTIRTRQTEFLSSRVAILAELYDELWGSWESKTKTEIEGELGREKVYIIYSMENM